MAGQLTVIRAVIPAAASLSNELDLRSVRLLAIQMPTAWTAATLEFVARPRLTDTAPPGNDVVQSVLDTSGGAEPRLAAAASSYLVLSAAHQAWCRGLAVAQIRSGTNGAPVVQAAERQLLLVVEPRGI